MAGIFGPEPEDFVADDSDEYEDDEDDVDDGDEQEGAQGVFTDNQSIYSNRLNNPSEAVHSFARDPGAESPFPGQPYPAPTMRLASIFDGQGNVFVAATRDGQRVEAWRAPSQSELHALQTRGQFVQGGLAAPPEGQAAQAPPAASSGGGMLKSIVGALVIGGIGYWWWKKRQPESDSADDEGVDEVEDEDDAEEE